MRRFAWAAIAAMVLVTGAWFVLGAVRENAVRRAAATLTVPADWAVTSESFRSAALFCPAGRCPELSRTYRAPNASPAELDRVLRNSGWLMDFDAQCEPSITVVEEACSATGTAHGQLASLYAFGDPLDPVSVEVTIHIG